MSRTRNVLAVFLAGLALAVLAPATAFGHSGRRAHITAAHTAGGGSAWVTFRRNDFRPSGLVRRVLHANRSRVALRLERDVERQRDGIPCRDHHPAGHEPLAALPRRIHPDRGLHLTVNVRPGPGSFNNYRLDIYSPGAVPNLSLPGAPMLPGGATSPSRDRHPWLCRAFTPQGCPGTHRAHTRARL